MKSVKKSTIVLTAIIVVLVVGIGVFAWLNRGSTEESKKLQENQEFILKVDGKEKAKITMDEIKKMNPEKITVTMDTSKTEPTKVNFTCVKLSKIYKEKDIDISSKTKFQASALDGYSSAYTADDVNGGYIYICFEKNGKALGTKSDSDGMGPFLVVQTNVTYSQSWCKYLKEIDAG